HPPAPPPRTRLVDSLETSQSSALRSLATTPPVAGMRSGEVIILRWQQVDLLARTITVAVRRPHSGTGPVIPIDDDLANHRASFVAPLASPRGDIFPWRAWWADRPDAP